MQNCVHCTGPYAILLIEHTYKKVWETKRKKQKSVSLPCHITSIARIKITHFPRRTLEPNAIFIYVHQIKSSKDKYKAEAISLSTRAFCEPGRKISYYFPEIVFPPDTMVLKNNDVESSGDNKAKSGTLYYTYSTHNFVR